MSKSLLIIGLVWPEPTSSAAGWRMLQIIDLFLHNGYTITFASAASKSEHSFPLNSKGITEKEILLNDSSFDEFIKELNPDLVLFDRFMVEEQFSWRVAQSCPNAVRILDTEDLHFVRNARQEAYKKGLAKHEIIFNNDLAKRELASIYRSDLSLIISEYEMKLLDEQFRIDPKILEYLPFQVTKRNKPTPAYSERKNFMFIGNFLHEPNWKTVQVLKELWPQVRKRLPQAEIHIYGAYPSEKVFQLHNAQQGFIIKGRAENAIETMEHYRVLLAPIPFGAGQKGKFIDALFAGTPSVTTEVGAEGMMNNIQWPGFIAGNNEELITQAILFHEDKKQWKIAREKSDEALKSLFDENWGTDLIDKIKSIQTDLQHHRSMNMVGEILWSSQFLATKYMSQWIESKNKKAHT